MDNNVYLQLNEKFMVIKIRLKQLHDKCQEIAT